LTNKVFLHIIAGQYVNIF